MPGVRPFVQDDIPHVLALNVQSFPGSAALDEDEQRWRFREICFNNPWYDEHMPSLVYEDRDGKIVGFIAVVPRRMTLNGRTVVMAVSQHLMVDPTSRAKLAAVELVQRFLSGPQGITLADMSTDLSRRIWERLGGKTSYLYSLHWRKPLRPLSFAIDLFKNASPVRIMSPLARPIASAADSAASLFMSKRTQTATTEPLTPEQLLMLIPDFYSRYALLPDYNADSIGWLFSIQARERRFGVFQHVLVRDSKGRPLGWFIYHLKRGGTSQVLQIGAKESTVGVVLDLLFEHARKGGAMELTGRVEPMLMNEFSQKRCLFVPGRSWVLVSSKSPEALQSFGEGTAFVTRLEGDPWFF